VSLRDRIERTLRFTLLVFVLAAVAFLSAITAMRIAIRGRIVTMPNLIGMPAGEAEQLLASQRLGLSIADRIYSPLPPDAVVRQSPGPGQEIKAMQNAHVVLSLGPQSVVIPDVEGRSLRLARVSLLRSGLQVGQVSNVRLPGNDPDVVLRQQPPAGAEA
jgi:serine/threonine-protein kinase